MAIQGKYQSRMRKEKFPHKGDFEFEALSIQWKEVPGGEIQFKLSEQADKDSYVKLSTLIKQLETNPQISQSITSDDMELAIVNKLMAHYRPHALPDENSYYAASAGVTDRGKLFVAVNNEIVIKHAFAGRGCAETTMLRKVQESEGAETQLSALYLSSGIASKQPNGMLIDKNPDR